MASEKEYFNLSGLTEKLGKNASKLEQGKMSLEEVAGMCEDAREIYERLVVLTYKAGELAMNGKAPEVPAKETKQKARPGSKVKAMVDNLFAEQQQLQEKTTEEEELRQQALDNEAQTSLIDAIQQAETPSLNEKLVEKEKKSMASKLEKVAIKDLKAAIDLNLKFQFINELFGGESNVYKEAIEKLNGFSTADEAVQFVEDTIIPKHKWDMETHAAMTFMELLERRFATA